MKHSVLVLYNQPSEGCGESEAGILQEVEAVCKSLKQLRIKHRAVGAESFTAVSKILAQSPERIVFNLVEGFCGSVHDVNFVPAVCRVFGKAVTGNDTNALTLGLDKWRSKLIFKSAGLPVPEGVLVEQGHRVKKAELPDGPYIVKPVATDASEGIDFHSIIKEPGKELDRVIAQIHEEFCQAALVEQFVGEREVNVSVVQIGDETRVLPLAEIDFGAFEKGKPRIVGYSAKWKPESFEFNNTPRVIPAPLNEKTAARVRECALDAWHAAGCQDYARVDFRVDKKGKAYLLEVNPNPDISPDAGFAAAVLASGMEYGDFVLAMVENAAGRLEGERLLIKKRQAGPKLSIRRSEAGDREAVLEFLKATNFFRPDEIDIAAEVFDEAIAKGPKGHYQSFSAVMGKKVIGWVCWGPTACTIGTYDIYWVGVDPTVQARGIGRGLMDFAEKQIKKAGGHLSVVETSGKPQYVSTRRFYEKIGYLESSRVWDFYAPGDDKVIYIKRL